MVDLNKSILSWSGGKDGMLSLHKIASVGARPLFLFSTINRKRQRVTMHGVGLGLLQKQVDALGYSLDLIELPEGISMWDYNGIMSLYLREKQKMGVEGVIYGDIFLKDLRSYRDKEVGNVGLKAFYPLWEMNTDILSREFINLGFKAKVVSVNDSILGPEYVGKEFDMCFLRSLPVGVDSCGENGEFHTYVYDGPLFSHPVDVQVGEKVFRTYEIKEDRDCFCPDNSKLKEVGYWFCELS